MGRLIDEVQQRTGLARHDRGARLRKVIYERRMRSDSAAPPGPWKWVTMSGQRVLRGRFWPAFSADRRRSVVDGKDGQRDFCSRSLLPSDDRSGLASLWENEELS